MAELKTQATTTPVADFLATIENETRRTDAQTLVRLFEEITGEKAKLWGTAIIGFGSSVLTYESGRTLDWFPIGFSPRKQNLALYLKGGADAYPEILARIGKYTQGKGCLYINKLADTDPLVVRELVLAAWKKASTG